MITISVPAAEYYSDISGQFINTDAVVLQMEHSLRSIRDWESKWNVAFLGDKEKTNEQAIDYLRFMTVSPRNVDPLTYYMIPQTEMKRISEYIRSPMTATVFYDDKQKTYSRETVTADLVYYWMIALNIPIEFQNVHFNQLLTLIRVTSIKNTPPKKMSKADILRRNARLNEERRRKLNTRG